MIFKWTDLNRHFSEKKITQRVNVWWKDTQHHQPSEKGKWDTTFTLTRKAIVQETDNNKCWWQCEETLMHFWEGVKWCSCFGKQSGLSLKSWKDRSYHLVILLLHICPRKVKTNVLTKTWRKMFIVDLLTVKKWGKTPNVHQLRNECGISI